MIRLVGIEVDEYPKILSSAPSISNHFIRFASENLRMLLKLSGVISFLPCRKPGEDELEDHGGVL